MALVHDSIPDSEICKKATQLVTEVSPTSLCNHCIRTFLFGDLLAYVMDSSAIANCCIWVLSCMIWD